MNGECSIISKGTYTGKRMLQFFHKQMPNIIYEKGMHEPPCRQLAVNKFNCGGNFTTNL